MAAVTPLTPQQIAERLTQLPGWTYEGGMLRRAYATDGWPTTLMLVNAIGFYAEAADHHPDLEVGWGRVAVALRTHSAGGVTEQDVELARLIERTALWRPDAASPFRGTRKKFVTPAEPG
jgi:4a-hydroxytetrahydrobiopterin dehydratase